jgi:outer membrane protein OmpA-like peptidoglycan-associated protein
MALLGVLAATFLWRGSGEPDGPVAAVTSVYFEPGQTALDAADRQAVAAVADSAREIRGSVEVTGYAEETGERSKDLMLARTRANAVRDALVAEGVQSAQIVTKSPERAPADALADAGGERVSITVHGPASRG